MNTALGWALVHFVWQGAVIALALAAALAACRGAKIRYTLACAAMIAMAAVFAVTFAWSIPDPASPVRTAWQNPAPYRLGSGAITEPAAPLLERALPWLGPVWMGGVLLLGLYRFAGWRAVQRLRRTAVCAAPPAWQQRLTQLARRIGVSSPVALLESALTEVPVTIGFLRPAILLPAGLVTGLPASQLEAILLHELAHIRRLDYLVNLLQTAVESLLFYHPAVWWVSTILRAERENCCDDMVLDLQGDPREYAAALLTLEEKRGAGREPALAATGGNLMNRIRRMLHQPEQPPAAAGLMLSMLLLLALFVLLASAQQPSPGPYQKWVDEDAAYIIRPEERAAYLRLNTDEERARFIEQFWLRRDPTRDTPENEFKQEHYRRIGYSNERFPAKSAPGWKTDRGRLYIVYGPPDEIESHPVEGREQWLYHYLEGIGKNVIIEFLDPNGTGEYRQTRDPRAIQ